MENKLVQTNDWEMVWRIERDICYLYHQLSEYSGIDGDQSYTNLFNLPYWEFIDGILPSMRTEEEFYVRSGCLMFILAMAWDIIDGSGTYLLDHMDSCTKAVENIQPQDANMKQLIVTVKLALTLTRRPINQSSEAVQELSELSVWANKTFVKGYFASKVAISDL